MLEILGPVADISSHQLEGCRRILLYGPPGTGKSTMAQSLARMFVTHGRECWCISADPGTPAFGLPGAVSLGRWTSDRYKVITYEALCTLDAGRFRLPLMTCVHRLHQAFIELSGDNDILLVDAPGVVRGVAGRELLSGLMQASEADTVVVLTAEDREPPLIGELRALASPVYVAYANMDAKRPGKRVRARLRTAQWDDYLDGASEHKLEMGALDLIGTPPPLDIPAAWIGRQVGLMHGKKTEMMGEVVKLEDKVITIKAPHGSITSTTLLVRDAQRTSNGVIETAVPFASEKLAYLSPGIISPYKVEDSGPVVVGQVGSVDVALPNGVFGDALLHVRLRQQGRSLLFDLGEGSRLSGRIAHQVTDVFVSHAHMDHLGGFQWLLRSRLGDLPACRLYGPVGLTNHVESYINSFLWDRVGEFGPVFEVAELHENTLKRTRLQAGKKGREELDDKIVADGIILHEAGFQVSAVVLDHKTPVIAYALQQDKIIHIRKDVLQQLELKPGPWLTQLKQAILAGNLTEVITLPDGSVESVQRLAGLLALVSPGKKLVYATDLADTPDNRERLQALARNAHTFFCEAVFIEADRENADRTGHLTARAAGEIANAAGVSRLVPFHLSRRYSENPDQIYAEISMVCPRVVKPQSANFVLGKSS
jgi:ribonuclease BN (tRNA processing enzyme)/polynucleotide 5'-kinase involved in rRNA processing